VAFARTFAQLTRLANAHLNSTVFVLGSGPSLRDTNLELLRGQIVLFLNHSRRLAPQIEPGVSYTIVQDSLRQAEILGCLRKGEVCLAGCDSFKPDRFNRDKYSYPAIWFMPRVKLQRSRRIFYPTVDLDQSISRYPLWSIYQGHSVVFSAIQLAIFMGARRIALVGVDMNYTSSDDIQYGISGVAPGQFELNYVEHYRRHFQNARRFLEERGGELLYATRGGRVDVLQAIRLEQAVQISGRGLGSN
jgi:hypothetical protein